ncbi:MAG: DUF4397 domain-containing protein, partial [Balneolales bacterium]|nr:DUF4397 domain-containing protein [Balneolales bacterium]
MKFLTENFTRLMAFMVIFALPVMASAQTTADIGEDGPAFVQIVHNSADPAAAEVDIYLNGGPLLENFAFRDATEFLELEADVLYEIAVAPGGSNSVADALATFEVTLAANTSYVVVASGVLDPSNFADNPDDTEIGFNLEIIANVQQEASSTDDVIINVFHGATDAPAVDILARAETPITLVPNAAYTDAATITVDPAEYILDINVAGTSTTAASFDADLSGAGGAAVTVLASGFLNVEANQYGEQFGLLAVFADGSTALLPARTAQAQIIHNSADPGAEMVDIYVNGALALDGFAFRDATPFIEFPARLTHFVAVAPPNSESVEDAIATFELSIPEGANWQVVANGVLDPSEFASNPADISTAFDLFVLPMAREEAESGSGVDFRVFHGATDAPAVDVRLADGGAVLVDDISYQEFSDYLNVAADMYEIDITAAGNGSAVVASYGLDISSLDGGSALILASGFLDPADNQNGEAFELLVVLASGDSFILPLSTSIDSDMNTAPVAFEFQGNYPNPFNPTTNIQFSVPNTADVSLTVYDLLGRQ